MSLPSEDRVENAVNSIGIETYPENVIVKGSLWTLNLIYGRFLLKDYGGNSFILDIITKAYNVTLALNDDRTINPDKFWLWSVSLTGVLSLYEVEPFTNSAPTITLLKDTLDTDVVSVSVYVQANDAVRIIILNSAKELKAMSYLNIKTSTAFVTRSLVWGYTRLSDLSNFVHLNKDQLDLVYLDVLSPPNVYMESFSILPPTNLSAAQIGDTSVVVVNWDAAVDADQYVLERDTDSSFSSPVEVYTGPDITFTDHITISGVYYFRVKSQISDLYLESAWAPWFSLEVIPISIVADFTASSLDVFPNEIIQFTDLSTPVESITAWDWDFGDGYTSTSQNPTHSYALPGVYTVTLRALSSTSEDQMTKIDYIEVEAPLIADFIGNPLSGNQPLQVQFTDLSTPEGTVTSWEWNFGDSSPFSTLQNPVHSYALPGRYTVTLTVSNGSYENQITKVNYIEVVYVEIAEEEPEPITGGGFTRSGGPTLIFD